MAVAVGAETATVAMGTSMSEAAAFVLMRSCAAMEWDDDHFPGKPVATGATLEGAMSAVWHTDETGWSVGEDGGWYCFGRQRHDPDDTQRHFYIVALPLRP